MLCSTGVLGWNGGAGILLTHVGIEASEGRGYSWEALLGSRKPS